MFATCHQIPGGCILCHMLGMRRAHICLYLGPIDCAERRSQATSVFLTGARSSLQRGQLEGYATSSQRPKSLAADLVSYLDHIRPVGTIRFHAQGIGKCSVRTSAAGAPLQVLERL